ncbi:glycosyltransferase [Algibacter mikhailovii]|uniref:Glycosyltransferase 2-like domain-containing protein n=1 Tax=Algibacter mikhailovii TaxID=425498 RepID=A0A918V410_9FLAO|nr:glycosyltransferase [Algibacter mikhailovii]GGZ68867.1 hypothetical protein GCM10007028_02250 [Algibacter mikhailovii]
MKLSVLIPVFNGEDYIAHCLDTLISQDILMDDYEIVIMNDGSTDNTGNIILEYKKKYPNIKYYSENNVGVYVVRNRLIKLAKGDYIYFIDADDYIANNSLGTLLNCMIENNVELLGFQSSGTTLIKRFEWKRNEETLESPELISGKEFLVRRRNLNHEIWWYFVKRSFLINQNITFDNDRFNADVLFTLKLLWSTKKMIFLPIVFHKYYQSPKSISRNKDIDKRNLLIDNRLVMINKYSRFINEIEVRNKEDKILISNLLFRRDVFTFSAIINMIKTNRSASSINDAIASLKEVGAYPLNHLTGKEYNTLFLRFLCSIINKQRFLNVLLPIRNKVFKGVIK